MEEKAILNGAGRLESYAGKVLKDMIRVEGTGVLNERGTLVIPCVEIDGNVYKLSSSNYTDEEKKLNSSAMLAVKERQRKQIQDIFDYVQKNYPKDEVLLAMVKAIIPMSEEERKAKQEEARLKREAEARQRKVAKFMEGMSEEDIAFALEALKQLK